MFRGWFDIGAARAVTAPGDDGTDVARLVLHLVDRSLITADRDGGAARYRLLETLRGYGLERLEQRGDLDAARGRHARWAAELVTQAARGLRGPGEAGWAARLDSHIGDLRAAHSWLTGHDTELSLRMCAELHWYALLRCQSEVFRWADVSAAAAAGSRSPFYPQALASAAWGAVYRGDLQAADTAAHAALDAAQGLAPITARRALQALGDLAIYRGDLQRAADRYLHAYDLSMQAGDWLDAAWDAASAGVALAYGNHLTEAIRLAGQGRDAAVRSGAPSALALVLSVLGEITATTDPGQARQHLQRAVELATPAGSRLVAGFAEVSLATLHARHGEPATALRYYHQVISQWRQAGTWTPLWVTIRTLIDLLTRVGACHDAATLYGAAASASYRRTTLRRRRRPPAPDRGPATPPSDRHRVPLLHRQRRTTGRRPGHRPRARSHRPGRREAGCPSSIERALAADGLLHNLLTHGREGARSGRSERLRSPGAPMLNPLRIDRVTRHSEVTVTLRYDPWLRLACEIRLYWNSRFGPVRSGRAERCLL